MYTKISKEKRRTRKCTRIKRDKMILCDTIKHHNENGKPCALGFWHFMTSERIAGLSASLSAQASAAVGPIQPAALLFSTHLSNSPNPPTGNPRPAAPSFTVPSPRHFHCGNPHLPRHWFTQKNAQNRTRESTEPRSRRHRPAQENTKGPRNKTHSPAQQKALARMTQKH